MSSNPQNIWYASLGLSILISLLMIGYFIPKTYSNYTDYKRNKEAIQRLKNQVSHLLSGKPIEPNTEQAENGIADLKEHILSLLEGFKQNETRLIQAHSNTVSNSEIRTESVYLSLSGPFQELLQIPHQFESALSGAQLTSVDYVKNERTNELMLKLIIELRAYEN